MLSQASIRALSRLRNYKPPPTQWYNCPLSRRAAVLILLFPDKNGDLKVILTMRAATLRSYAGQVALPGGKADTLPETPFEIARREAFEEIGLPPTPSSLPPSFQVEHLCEMPANLAKTELGVRPCVAFLCQTDASSSSSSSSAAAVEETMIPRLDPREVEAVFTAPFRSFLREEWDWGRGKGKGKGKAERWYRGGWTEWHGTRWRMHNFYIPRPVVASSSSSKGGGSGSGSGSSASSEATSAVVSSVKEGEGKGSTPQRDAQKELGALDDLNTFRVFGMTARILVDAARVAYGEEPDFEDNAHFGDEEMIGRLLRMGRLSEVRKEGGVLSKEVPKGASKI